MEEGRLHPVAGCFPGCFNVRYFDEAGNERLYLGINVDRTSAEKWKDEFNRMYRKPFPNGNGYYASAIVVEMKPFPNGNGYLFMPSATVVEIKEVT